jgi:hypothetical protein
MELNPGGDGFGHGDRIFQRPEVPQQGSLDERALWESIGDGRREGARSNLVRAPGDNSHR